jgi:voltage-gated potassium channel
MKKISPLIIWFAIIILISVSGVAGFMYIEGFSFLQALYMTVITITTIGYGETKALTDSGRIFNIILIITSFSTFTYALASLTQYFASGEMARYFKNKKLMAALQELNDHVIVCGFGRNGQQAAQTLQHHKVEFVVIENKEHSLDAWIREGKNLLHLVGDATEDTVLLKAGIGRAKALVCTLPVDADNVFIVLSARSLNPNIQIISRASQATSVLKLKKAGADHVILPDKIGGTHMATLVSKPDVIEFIDYLSGEEGESISLESVAYNNLPAELRDRTLKEIMAWRKTGVNCIGIKDAEGKFFINPPEETVISQNMRVIVLGTKPQIDEMKANVG